jgi:hypothetical protein
VEAGVVVVAEWRRGTTESVDVEEGKGGRVTGFVGGTGRLGMEVWVEGGKVEDRVGLSCSFWRDVNEIGGDVSCFFQGETPGVDKLGEDNGTAGDGIPLPGRLCGDGLDGVGCGTVETFALMSRFLILSIVVHR